MSIFKEPIKTKATILLTDSRFLSDPAQSIFFAIKGERHNGHQYIWELYQKGIRSFVIEKDVYDLDENLQTFCNKQDVEIWKVSSSIKALQNLAAGRRKKYSYPVIGITGSNGKTIVKEWLSEALQGVFEIVKSPRSYNSQIGVALSVWEMTEKQNLAIFEAGISLQNEMQNLEDIIKPELGIFTNIGTAHNEGFRSLKQKITEKLRLFRGSKALIYCRDYEEVNQEIEIFLKAVNPGIELYAWSLNSEGDNKVSLYKFNNYTEIHIDSSVLGKITFNIPYIDDASIENAIHCAFAGLYLNNNYPQSINDETFFNKFQHLKPVAMRLELKQGIHNNYVIDDTYNNDLGGLKMALNFMSQHQTSRYKVLIISDIPETGLSELEIYEALATQIKSQNIKVLICIGPKISNHVKLFKNCAIDEPLFYDNTEDFLLKYNFDLLRDALILVKGARVFSFERIVNKLVMKVHGTVFEVNLDALTHNLNHYRAKIGSSTKIMVMVKAFAYGSGSTEVASWLQYHRVDYLAVAYPDEGIALRKNGITLPIMVLNADVESYAKMFEFNLEPEIYSFRVLKGYIDYKAENLINENSKLHLKIDTGMHRLGFDANEIDELCEILNIYHNIEIASVFSHLVGADAEEHIPFSKMQINNFEIAALKIKEKTGQNPLMHICNSAGITRFPEAKFDMVRLGIGLYGIESAGLEQSSLKTVGSLKTTISQIKTIKENETVGYSRKGVLKKDTKIATLAIGYADGYDRGFSNGVGKVMVNGTLCPVVGNVCMDMTMIDVTDATCFEGNQVTVFGENPSITTLASSINTIPYEILTNVSERVKRVFYHE